MVQRTHELFEELDAFDSRWLLKYSTLYDAAVAAGVLHLYSAYQESKRYERTEVASQLDERHAR